MGIQYNYSIFSSSQCLPIPPATLHVRKRWFGSPPERHMETKYTCEWLEKRRAKPMCFVSRNQKRPGRHFYCFLETKHAQNPGLFPVFPLSCVSTSTLYLFVYLGRFLSSGKMNQNAKMNFILAFFISTFATLSC